MLVELRAYILGDSTVQGLIGTRMYPITLPQRVIFPAVSYQVISTSSRGVMLHDDNLPVTRVQIDAWSLLLDQALAVDEAIRVLFHDYEPMIIGGSPGVLVAGVFKDNRRTEYEPDTLLYRASRDYRIFHAE